MKILYIAKNIPTPLKKTNRIIFDIAHHLAGDFKIDFVFPKEIVPFWLRKNPRFAYLYRLKKWDFEGFTIDPISYVKLPFKKMQYWTLCTLSTDIKRYFKKSNRPNVVHAHYLFPDGYMAYRIFRKYRIPYVLTFRNQDKQYLKLISINNPDYRKASNIIKTAKQVIVPNGGYKKFVETRFGVKCTIIPHGIEKEVFRYVPTNDSEETLTIISVADGVKTKNIDWVIKAFKAYSGPKKIKLQLAGDVCKRNDIIQLAKEDRRIQLLGKVPHNKILQLMKNSDIFALPSSKETFGLVYLEAAATQNAMIGYKGEGVWGGFNEEKEMLFGEDFKEFKEHLLHFIADEKLRTKLAQRAYEKAKTMSWENVKKMYESIYLKALE